MTETQREQRPLLCDVHSDEELLIPSTSPKFQRRFRCSISTGRARTHALGAAAIITRWPDHLSSLLTYWWIGFGMTAVTVFIIYNSIMAVVTLPTSHNKPLKFQNSKYTIDSNSFEDSSATNIYMHVFVSNYDEFNINDYVPHLSAVTEYYTNFKYNFIVLSDVKSNDLNDEERNEMALNSLWSDNIINNKRKVNGNYSVKFISFTEYMDNSPVKKYWRLLPHQVAMFLARCISIWEKGGVAFNPVLLTRNTPNHIYLKKIKNILSYIHTKNKLNTNVKRNMSNKSKKPLNNIRDIIDNLENESDDVTVFPDNLSEAENIQSIKKTSIKSRKIFSDNQHIHSASENIRKLKDNVSKRSKSSNSIESKSIHFGKTDVAINSSQSNNITANQNLIPKFLEFLFHVDSKRYNPITKKFTINAPTRANDLLNSNSKLNGSTSADVANVNSKITALNKTNNRNENTKLFIDLKGNLIATETACHAFIGTVFSNIKHNNYTHESLSDFITSELSLFCKGSLSNCHGVEVILL